MRIRFSLRGILYLSTLVAATLGLQQWLDQWSASITLVAIGSAHTASIIDWRSTRPNALVAVLLIASLIIVAALIGSDANRFVLLTSMRLDGFASWAPRASFYFTSYPSPHLYLLAWVGLLVPLGTSGHGVVGGPIAKCRNLFTWILLAGVWVSCTTSGIAILALTDLSCEGIRGRIAADAVGWELPSVMRPRSNMELVLFFASVLAGLASSLIWLVQQRSRRRLSMNARDASPWMRCMLVVAILYPLLWGLTFGYLLRDRISPFLVTGLNNPGTLAGLPPLLIGSLFCSLRLGTQGTREDSDHTGELRLVNEVMIVLSIITYLIKRRWTISWMMTDMNDALDILFSFEQLMPFIVGGTLALASLRNMRDRIQGREIQKPSLPSLGRLMFIWIQVLSFAVFSCILAAPFWHWYQSIRP